MGYREGILVRGLNDAQVLEARRLHGTNEITRRKRRGFFKKLMESFGDPIIKILLVALFVNIMFMFRDADIYETLGIAFAVLLATLVSTLSEHGSESAFERLQEESQRIRCRVLRGGRLLEVPVAEVVVGDVVYLQAGERVPADGAMLQGELGVDQSALNGETYEARKRPGRAPQAEEGFSNPAMIFRGSVVCSGEGVMRVSMVGDETFYGRLAFEVQEETVPSPLKERLTRLAHTICRLGYACAAVVVFATLFNDIVVDNHHDPQAIAAYLADRGQVLRDVMRALTLGLTVVVMAVPEGLPMMITVVLSSNMRKMMKDNVLVRKLVGVETAGSLNILFTDKTGTLTKGELEVAFVLDASGNAVKEYSKFVKLNCYLNNGAKLGSNIGRGLRAIGGNSTDRALLDFIKNDISEIVGYKRTETVPFDSEKKYSAARVSNGGRQCLLVKGAPEVVLAMCKGAYAADGRKRPMADMKRLMAEVEEHCRVGSRVIALAASEDGSMDSIVLVGFVAIRDELRPEAAQAISTIGRAGVQVVMITGDNAETAAAIARKAGILDDGGMVLTSVEMERLSDAELAEALPQLRVIARATPQDKSRLVRIAQENELVAGMTGDGVNDAPALRRADVGFAMGGGTEVAKEAGDIVILDNNISSICKAILYGRTVFKSIRKFIVFQLTVNICAVGVSVLGPFIGVDAPVTIIQMLWINIIMDTLGGLAFAGEAPLDEYMEEPPKRRNENIINGYMYNQMLVTGLYTVAVCVVFISVPWFLGFFRGDSSILMSAFFALFIFAGIFNSFNARTNRLNLFAYLERNRGFIIIMALVSIIQLSMVYYGGALFRAAALLPGELAMVIGLAFTVVLADAVRKAVLRALGRPGTI